MPQLSKHDGTNDFHQHRGFPEAERETEHCKRETGSGFTFVLLAVVQELSTHASPTEETPESHPTSTVNCECVLLLVI